MKIANHIIGLAAAAMLSASADIAGAVPAAPVEPPQTVIEVQGGDCNALARQMAQQYGGRARASVQTRGSGQRVCVVVIVVEGKGGERGQRIKREFPLN